MRSKINPIDKVARGSPPLLLAFLFRIRTARGPRERAALGSGPSLITHISTVCFLSADRFGPVFLDNRPCERDNARSRARRQGRQMRVPSCDLPDTFKVGCYPK